MRGRLALRPGGTCRGARREPARANEDRVNRELCGQTVPLLSRKKLLFTAPLARTVAYLRLSSAVCRLLSRSETGAGTISLVRPPARTPAHAQDASSAPSPTARLPKYIYVA